MKLKFSSKTVSTFITFLVFLAIGLFTIQLVGEGEQEEAISFEEYHESVSENQEWADISESEENVSEEIILSFEQIVDSVNSTYNCSGKITESAFSDGTGIRIDKISFLEGFTPENVSYSLGYIFAGDKILDIYGNDHTSLLAGYNFSGCRDLDGNALFEKDGKYYFVKDGAVAESSNSRFVANNTKYFMLQDDAPYFFKSGGKWGLKDSSGKAIVSASFTHAHGISEGVAVFATKENVIYLYDAEGDKLSDEFVVPTSGKGFGFFRNGIMLASDGSKNIILKSNGAVLDTPVDYTVKGCSDGMILLQKNGISGYMCYDGSWKINPAYTYASNYSEGLAVVSDGELKVIDTNGNIIVPGIFDQIYDFSDGVTFAYSSEKGWHIIQKQILS